MLPEREVATVPVCQCQWGFVLQCLRRVSMLVHDYMECQLRSVTRLHGCSKAVALGPLTVASFYTLSPPPLFVITITLLRRR
jgi:hypothetical protein